MILSIRNKIVIFLCYLCLDTIQGTCSDEFSVTKHSAQSADIVPIDDVFMELSVSVNETLLEGTLIYIVSWNSNVSKEPELNDEAENTAGDYVTYEILLQNNNMEFSILQSMAGLVDYGTEERKTTLKLNLYFDFIGIDNRCKLEITHILVDENTQEPSFVNSSYDVIVREDFPTNLPIPGLELWAHDYDADWPNNEFDVLVNDDCPIKPISSSYKCENGASVPVQFVLYRPLDYDVMNDSFIEDCNVTLLNDLDNLSLSSVTEIKLTIESSRDEYPVFSADYYKGNMVESTQGSVIDVIPPISAYDPDLPSSEIEYSMKSVESTIEADEYLEIDPMSGIITVKHDIDSEFLSYLQINFFLIACDEDAQCSTALLVIVLNKIACDVHSLYFEKQTYTTQLISPEKGDIVLTVHAQASDNNEEDLIYYFASESSYFVIDSKSGNITITEENLEPGLYSLTTMVTDGDNTDQTMVNVEILLGAEGILVMNESVILKTVPEDSIGVLLTVHAEGANMYCMESIIPNYWSDSFELDSSTGKLEIISSLDVDSEIPDVDDLLSTFILLKIGAYKNEVECTPSEITPHLESYESLVIIFMTDVNEYPPYFVDISGINLSISRLVYAYPQNEALQKTLGPVATVSVEDPDRTSSLIFSLLGSSEFVIDEKSGELYHVAPGVKNDEYSFSIVVDDTKHHKELMVEVTNLDFDHIFTLNFIGMDMNDVQQTLEDMSLSTKMSIYLLYANVVDTKIKTASTSNKWNIEANVYATLNFELVDLQEFNNHLDSGGIHDIKAVSFRDRVNYETIDSTPVAAIVLGCILGLLLLILASMGFYYCYNQRSHKQEKSSPLQVKTLGQVYDGAHFKEDEITDNEDKELSIKVPHSNGQDNSGCQVENLFSEPLYPILLMEEEPPFIHPLSQVATQYESEINEAASSIKKSLESNGSRNSPHAETIFGNFSLASTGENFLNVSSEKASVEEEPKSVAFKVLVDIQDPEEEGKKF